MLTISQIRKVVNIDTFVPGLSVYVDGRYNDLWIDNDNPSSKWHNFFEFCDKHSISTTHYMTEQGIVKPLAQLLDIRRIYPK